MAVTSRATIIRWNPNMPQLLLPEIISFSPAGVCGFSMTFRCGWRIARISYCRRCCYKGTGQSYLPAPLRTCVWCVLPSLRDRRSPAQDLQNRRLMPDIAPQRPGSTKILNELVSGIWLPAMSSVTRGGYVFRIKRGYLQPPDNHHPADAYRGTHFSDRRCYRRCAVYKVGSVRIEVICPPSDLETNSASSTTSKNAYPNFIFFSFA